MSFGKDLTPATLSYALVTKVYLRKVYFSMDFLKNKNSLFERLGQSSTDRRDSCRYYQNGNKNDCNSLS